ncbi:MAG: hypothetical protein KIT20_13530 [Alphaproteobacteria bacterium]|nr:hypothetical protein [Alphaproteobacteria bacterium]
MPSADILRCLVLAAGLTLAAAGPAMAIPFSFIKFTDNSTEDISGQLGLEVTPDGDNAIHFTFTNAVGIAASITDIYFDDIEPFSVGSLSIAARSQGVSFGLGATPHNVPGGNEIGFLADFSADSNAGPGGVSGNGVNAAWEFLTLRFLLIEDFSFEEVVARMLEGEFRIALHVQSIGAERRSDGYVTTASREKAAPEVPEGNGLGLLGLGLLTLGFALRRRVSSEAARPARRRRH